jgi:hypothetical protein
MQCSRAASFLYGSGSGLKKNYGAKIESKKLKEVFLVFVGCDFEKSKTI